ncbi:hypothetical protein NLI96_g7862 [Meripilus lineatus]|uniref:Uncharacterized protein n=1 Tax=Meripilus lineatus TaxID=2056292 RepID=A0AAD5V0K1_9APHY|nr:hypothetical protein NLI96_g7862 [Physisporinus lineatus]
MKILIPKSSDRSKYANPSVVSDSWLPTGFSQPPSIVTYQTAKTTCDRHPTLARHTSSGLRHASLNDTISSFDVLLPPTNSVNSSSGRNLNVIFTDRYTASAVSIASTNSISSNFACVNPMAMAAFSSYPWNTPGKNLCPSGFHIGVD